MFRKGGLKMEPAVPKYCGVGKGARSCPGSASRGADGSLRCDVATHHRAFLVQRACGVQWQWTIRGRSELTSKGLQVVKTLGRPVATPQKRAASEARAVGKNIGRKHYIFWVRISP